MKTSEIRVVNRYCWDHGYLMFQPTKGAPGFSHRVIINGKRVDWLAENYKPSKKNAAYFIEKHTN